MENIYTEANFSFIIPAKYEDLLNSEGDNYYVKQVYGDQDLPERLRECKRLLLIGDPFYIFDTFDTFYSIIENGSSESYSMTNLMRSFDLIYMTVDRLGEQLSKTLNSNDMSTQTRKKYLNLTKMTMFLFVHTVHKIDLIVKTTSNPQKKRSKNTEMSDQYPLWEEKRIKFLIQLFNIMQCPLEILWNPPIPDENFVDLLCDICYRTIELYGDHTRVINTVFQIFGTAIKRYNHAITFPVRILQILRTVESSPSAIALGISVLCEEYGINSILSVLIKEIIEALTQDSSDSVVSKNFSYFITDLSRKLPNLMIPHITTLSEELLNCESYVLRNCLLEIMGDAIVGELTSEELSDELKEARNEFLESLLDHINDVSAFVRCKVLSIWNNMKEENAVPLSFQLKVLCGAVERLEDKTSSVRKHAVQLIKSFLERNPFAPKLTLEELIQKHEEECTKMEKLRGVIEEERKIGEKLDGEWNLIIPTLMPIIEKNLGNCTQENYTTEENYDDMVKRITDLLLLQKYEEAVHLVRKADYIAGNSELRHTLQIEEQCAYYIALLKSYLFLANGFKDSSDELVTQIKTVEFLKDSIEFAKVITKAMPKIQELLMSRTNSDVFEAVDLFTTGYMFRIKGTESGMRQMLWLVWSSDKEKCNAVSAAYKKILFTTDETGRAHALKVVENLSNFLAGVDNYQYLALQHLISDWIASDCINAHIIQVLFERFTLKIEGTTHNESRLALQLLIMCSKVKHTIALANVNIIENIGLGERGRTDPRIYTACMEFLLNSIAINQTTKFYKRYDMENPLVQKVIDIYQKFFFHPQLPDSDSLTGNTIEFFYKMCQKPDIISENILIHIIKQFRDFGVKANELLESVGPDKSDNEAPISQQLQPSQTVQETKCQHYLPIYLITRFVHLIGYIALKEMIFLDMDIYSNMKYRQELTENEEKKKKNNPTRRKTVLNMNCATATESLKRMSGGGEPSQDVEDDIVGATAEDNFAELVSHICENVLLYEEKAILGKLVPYIIEICKYPGKYRHPLLQQAAVLTLIRIMCISSQFCEKNLPFLMNILNLTKNVKTKCNIIMGLTDLTFRFPNLIEPWTGHFYSTLHEENVEIRLTAVKMLSHLILNEMIRVKGQISDVALCIVDANDEIRNFTQQFFKEIANKSNILYNVLPDIISKLSDTSLNLQEEKYRTIMRYILGLIQKDRQVETLVEKLCLRFLVTREERQWRDIAFCLSLLSYNERALKKLIDNMQYYKDKVQIDEIYNSFKQIITNTSKLQKAEIKPLLVELETRLKECLDIKDDENNTDAHNANEEGAENVLSTTQRNSVTRKATAKSNTKTQSKNGKSREKSRGRRNKYESSSESDDDSGSDASASISRTVPQKNNKPRKQQSSTESSGEMSSNEDGTSEQRIAVNKQQTHGKPLSATSANMSTRFIRISLDNTRRSGRNKVIQETESSSEDINAPRPKRGKARN